jgi:hypothetical protein
MQISLHRFSSCPYSAAAFLVYFFGLLFMVTLTVSLSWGLCTLTEHLLFFSKCLWNLWTVFGEEAHRLQKQAGNRLSFSTTLFVSVRNVNACDLCHYLCTGGIMPFNFLGLSAHDTYATWHLHKLHYKNITFFVYVFSHLTFCACVVSTETSPVYSDFFLVCVKDREFLDQLTEHKLF